mgnify:CR=1 FL=1
MKTLRAAALLVAFGVNLTSCIPTGKKDKEPEIQPMASNGNLHSLTGRPVYLSSLIGQYGSEQAAFDAVIQYDKVVVDFYADWCGPCRALGQALTSLAKERNDILIIKVDVDAYGSISSRYGVRSIPTIVLFANGAQIHKATGFNGAQALKSMVNSYL